VADVARPLWHGFPLAERMGAAKGMAERSSRTVGCRAGAVT
jgi:hypothetical protein